MGTGVQIAYITNGYGKVQRLEEINVDMESKEKTRLINAHEVLLTDKERKACMFDAGMAFTYQEAKIIEAPTIEAIPVEWMKKYFNHCIRNGQIWYYDVKEDKLYQAWRVDDIIDECYRDWEKENETR